MRVLHLTNEFPPVIYGGLGTAVGGWVTASARAGISVAVQLVEGPLIVDGGVASTYYGYGYGGSRPATHAAQACPSSGAVSFFQSSWSKAIEIGIRTVRTWRPDVVHLHTATLWYVADIIQSETKTPLVYHVHSVDRAEYEIGHEPNPWLAHSHAQDQAIAASDRLIALTRSEGDLLARYYPEVRAKIRVVGNGIDDSDEARAAAFRPRPQGPPLILYSGRLVERKGIRELLDAILKVLDAAPDAFFVLAGGSPPLSGDEVAAQWLTAQHAQYRDRIHFTGWLSPRDVYRWYAAADILVVPSRYEPFGMVVLEGMLHGLPVIAAKVGGPADILEHGRTGLLFPPRDVTALAAGLRELVENAEDRRRMGHAAAREVRQTWLWDRLVPKMLRVYREFQPNTQRQTPRTGVLETESFTSVNNPTGVALSDRWPPSPASDHRDRLRVGGAVRVLGFIREDEVIAVFLQAEIGSSRFAPVLLEIILRDRSDRAIVDRPDLDNDHQNEYRRSLLSELRGWGASYGLFASFPAPVAWCRATLSWDELMMVRYANLPHWLYLSGGSRRPRDAARRLRAGLMPEIDLNFYKTIGNALSRGTAPQDLIMVSSIDGRDSVLVDGHARMTALALADQSSLRQLSTIIAFSDDLYGWAGY